MTPTPHMLWGIGSAIALAIGSVGPWMVAGPFTVRSTGDGYVTLGLAVICLALIAIRRFQPVVLALAIAAFAVGAIDTVDVLRTVNDERVGLFAPSIGWGLVVVDLAALALIGWALIIPPAPSRDTST